jgi:hypothetical protein
MDRLIAECQMDRLIAECQMDRLIAECQMDQFIASSHKICRRHFTTECLYVLHVALGDMVCALCR